MTLFPKVSRNREKYFGVDLETEFSNNTTLRRPLTTIIVRNNNVEKALRVLKRKIKKNGLMQELKERQYYQSSRKEKTC